MERALTNMMILNAIVQSHRVTGNIARMVSSTEKTL